MERSSTAREALVAELMGDMAQLLDRIDTLAPAMDNARREMTAAVHELTASVGPFKAHMGEIAEQTKKTSIQNIQGYTKYAAALLLETQTKAMTESARAMFDTEVGPPLRRLAWELEQLAKHVRRPWWEDWFTYGATAIASAICSAMFVLYVVHRLHW